MMSSAAIRGNGAILAVALLLGLGMKAPSPNQEKILARAEGASGSEPGPVQSSVIVRKTQKATSYPVPDYARMRRAAYVEVSPTSVRVDIDLVDAMPAKTQGTLAFQLFFPGPEQQQYVLVYAASRYVYNSRPRISPGKAAIVRTSDFHKLGDVKINHTGKRVSFAIPRALIPGSDTPSWLVSCYLPESISADTVVGEFEEQLADFAEFRKGSPGVSTIMKSTLLPRFLVPPPR